MALRATTSNAASGRIIRTVFQVLVATVIAVPSLISLLGLSATQSSEVTGVVGLVVIVVTSLHNGLEAAGILPAMFKTVDLPALTSSEASAASKLSGVIVANATKFDAAGAIVEPVIKAIQSKISTSQVLP